MANDEIIKKASQVNPSNLSLVNNAIGGGNRALPEKGKPKKINNLVNKRGPKAINTMAIDQINARIDQTGEKKNKNLFSRNINSGMTKEGFVKLAKGGTVNTYRRAQEGNIALGGMPLPPPSENGVSPDMAAQAKDLGIEVAPPGATAEEVADDQLVLLSEGELVVPANVVRYHGLAQYEKMRKAALDGLTAMDQEGQLVSPQETPAPEGLVGPPEGTLELPKNIT